MFELALLTLGIAIFVDAKEDENGPDENDAWKRQWVSEARALVATHFPDCPARGSCLFHAIAMIQVAKRHGRKLVLQAGTAYWERMPPEIDDGVSPTHFGYEWEADSPTTRARIAARMLPEMHIWVGDPATQEIIDISTNEFVDQARHMLGVDWPGKKPPDFLWAKASELPKEAVYQPDGRATRVAARFVAEMMRER